MNNVYQIKTASLELKDIDSKQGIISGYFAAFDILDMDNDIILKGAFQRSITNNGPLSVAPRIKHLQNHNPTQPLGKILELKEDSFGLFYRSKIAEHTLGVDFIKMAEGGLITEHSVGYQRLKEKRNAKGANEISELRLWEGSSLTAWGANYMTPIIDMKGVYDIEDINKRIEAVEIFCKNTDASDDTIQALLLQIKQLQQLLIDSTQPVDKTLDPPKDEKLNDQIKLLILKHYN